LKNNETEEVLELLHTALNKEENGDLYYCLARVYKFIGDMPGYYKYIKLALENPYTLSYSKKVLKQELNYVASRIDISKLNEPEHMIQEYKNITNTYDDDNYETSDSEYDENKISDYDDAKFNDNYDEDSDEDLEYNSDMYENEGEQYDEDEEFGEYDNSNESDEFDEDEDGYETDSEYDNEEFEDDSEYDNDNE